MGLNKFWSGVGFANWRNGHDLSTFLMQEIFRDKQFVRISRRVVMLTLPHAERAHRKMLIQLIEIYDDLLEMKTR